SRPAAGVDHDVAGGVPRTLPPSAVDPDISIAGGPDSPAHDGVRYRLNGGLIETLAQAIEGVPALVRRPRKTIVQGKRADRCAAGGHCQGQAEAERGHQDAKCQAREAKTNAVLPPPQCRSVSRP